MPGRCSLIGRGRICRQKIMLPFAVRKCYNIGNTCFAFIVNLAKRCTDITAEMHENCAWLDGAARERIGIPLNNLLLLFLPEGATRR
ncbi:MAG: hypothetical protein CEE38_01755 [Planctomycetes bacterium B3_Pla]|nr:MAG: hypothetical protein CEE38_01755 [Planctomycetes bacterium B3_Pla]